MTSGSILPSIGPPPPEFRRPIVPENLRPKLASEIAEQSSREKAPAQSAPQNNQRRPKIAPDAQAADTLVQFTGRFDKAASQSPGGQTVQADPPLSQQLPSANLGGASAVAIQVQEGQGAAVDVKEQKLQGELTEEEKAIVTRLRDRDREVRAHENAHASVGRGYTGTPSFEYARGPDGAQYAVGGSVDIDVSEVPNDPRATIIKMDVVRNAALAPARPSGQDRSVAAAASGKAQAAQAALAKQEKEEFEKLLDKNEDSGPATGVQAGGNNGSTVAGSNAEAEAGANFGSQLADGTASEPSAVFGVALTGSEDGAIGGQQTISIDLLV